MTPEERKAIAMRHFGDGPTSLAWDHYPNCCTHHEGFDDALALLKLRTTPLDTDHPLYAIEATP